MAESQSRRSCVEVALSNFLEKYGIENSYTDIDEIVLEYAVSVLEETGSASVESIDMEGFLEMMDAYYDGFSKIPQTEVYDWMFSLSSQLSELEDLQRNQSEVTSHQSAVTSHQSAVTSHQSAVTSQQSAIPHDAGVGVSLKNHAHDDSVASSEFDVLLEMFPSLCRTEIRQCIRSSHGDVDRAIDSLVRRHKNIPSVDAQHRKELTKELLNCNDDKILKDKMVEKYAFEVERNSTTEYKPIIPKPEQKKMVRYLESKIVNTRGERFTDVKKEDNEEMKKTYINLKPARKYRFH